MTRAPLAVTTGEPAGIGPEVSLKAALACGAPLVLIGSRELLRGTAERLGLPWPLPARIGIEDVALRVPAEPGRLRTENAAYVLEMLAGAHEGAAAGDYAAIVTAPVQKSIIIESGVPFTGHTEFFQKLSGVRRVVMMLTSDSTPDAMKVALATTHLPIAALSAAITGELLDEVIGILDASLRRDWGIASPRILVTGLNPHAGENGHIGTEEIDTIIPAIERARAAGIAAEGPVPADTAFVPGHWEAHDAVLCMYHDQGLPVLKHVGFSRGVNVTLGLPYVRTSVDHGTALDIAGRGIADFRSMISAMALAHYLASHRETRMA